MNNGGPSLVEVPTSDNSVEVTARHRLTAEELLAGADIEHEVEIPLPLLQPGSPEPTDAEESFTGTVRLRPLRLKDVQLIAKGAKDDEVLTSVLMIQRAVIEPRLEMQEVSRMPSGLVKFLVDRINEISGLTSSDAEIREMAGAPIVQTFFVLAKEFGWTPEEIQRLTIGQVMGFLEMLNRSRPGTA